MNHGIWKHAPSLEMTAEQWDETLRVSLTGAWAVCQQAARVMVPAGRGAIVTIASTAGPAGRSRARALRRVEGRAPGLTRSLGAELGPLGVRVNCVAPGWVVTDMSRDALVTPKGLRPRSARSRGARPARPRRSLAAVAFLASDRASYLYGEVLSVNGGAVMYD